MKKVSKKISKITKVFLVFAIIFSNLTCLKTVFAYEKNNDFELTLNEEENKLYPDKEIEPEEITPEELEEFSKRLSDKLNAGLEKKKEGTENKENNKKNR